MGLDITAYRQIAPAPEAEIDADGYPVDWDRFTRFYPNDDFPGRAGDVKPETVYKFAECMRFRAGSYSGYNQWRKWLASLVNITPKQVWKGEAPEDTPFLELINFSDCKGVIGAEVAAKLARDFAKIVPVGDDWDVALYAKWRAAFDMAADGGCVEFH